MSYACDTLPLHPPPEPWESLTSYLIRLATHNGMQYTSDLISLVFPHSSFRRKRLSMGDPLQSFDSLSQITGCSEAQLRATTVYYLAEKFGYIGNAYQLGLFFRGALAYHLRYCPGCLATQPSPFYSLLWRFRLLPGCIEHGSRLLEVCGHCGRSIRLLTPRSQMTTCSRCHQDLRRCSLQPMRNREWQSAYAAYMDLTVLLTNPLSELDSADVSSTSPQTNAACAQQRRQYIRSALFHLHKHIPRVRGGQDEYPRWLNFTTFCAYAEVLGVSIRNLWEQATGEQLSRQPSTIPALATYWEQLRFVEVSARQNRYSGRDMLQGDPRDQAEVVQRVRAAQDLLESRGQPITQRSIAVIVQIPPKQLRQYPAVRRIFRGVVR